MLRWSLWLAVPVAAVVVGSVVGVLYTFASVPLPEKAPTAQLIILEDRHGHQLTTLAPEENRREVPVETISANMKAAVLAAEDRGFFHHGAISYRGLARAAFANIVQRRVAQGGSTITQQYVKNAIPDVGRERTLFRKLKEAIMAVKLERRYSKEQILGFYLNTIYFGRGAYGVEAAARTYFPGAGRRPDATARTLTPAQAAFLASAIRSPEFYSRPENAVAARARRNIILQRMVQQGSLSPDVAAKAMAVPLGVTRKPPGTSGIAHSPAPYFLEKVRQQLVDRLGQQRVNLGGFKVVTTLDPRMQTAAAAAVSQVLTRPGDPEASLVAIEPSTGAVRAMYGGRNYQKQQFNLATDAMRQAGSTMKPFVLEQWLNDGNSVRAPFNGPSKIVVDGQVIHNYDDESYGQVDLMKATRQSINTVYMQLIMKTQASRVADLAAATGVNDVLSSTEKRPRLTRHPSLALGASGVSTLQLASAYGTWANDGVHVQPYLIEAITDLADRHIELLDQRGRKFGTHQAQRRQVVDRAVADTINRALQGVVERGTGTKAQIGRPAAGKTGTTDDYTDARFVGYTPDLVTSVWMGYKDERHKLLNVHGIPQVSGGSLPAVMWRDFMSRALAKTKPTPFAEPDLSTVKGQALNATTSTAAPQTTAAPATTVPPTTHPPSTTTPASSSSTVQLPSSTAPKSTRPPQEASEPPAEPPPSGG